MANSKNPLGGSLDHAVVEEKPAQLQQKTYYVASKGLTVHWKKEKKAVDTAGSVVLLEGPRDIVFMNGTFSTKNADEQNFLDSYGGLIPYEKWEEIHIPQKERTEKAKRENVAMKEQLEANNSELDRLRAQLAAKGGE